MATIKGTFYSKVFKNNKDGFTYFRVRTSERVLYKDNNSCIFCVGKIPDFSVGFPIEMEGDWDGSKRFVTTSVKEANLDRMVMKDFLLTIPGLGTMTAQVILQKVQDIFEFVKKPNAEEQLSSMGINKNIASLVVSTIKRNVDNRELITYLYKHGGEYKDFCKLLANFNKPLQELKDNPYKVGEQIHMDLSVMDSIAKENGLNHNNTKRVSYLINKAIKNCLSSGDCYVSFDDIRKQLKKLLEKGGYNEVPSETLLSAELSNNNKIKRVGNDIYLKFLLYAEISIAKNIKRLSDNAVPLKVDDGVVEKIEKEIGMKYAPQQRACFGALKTSGLKIVIGGPGTGKTTTINGLMKAYSNEYPNNKIMLVAPTGRAAQRMNESTGRNATTVHKGIELKPYGTDGTVASKNAGNPLDADAIVVDEMSMVDTEIFCFLLEAIKNGALVLLVGDTNQLESVGPGKVLADLIDSECVEVYKLTEIYRQKGDSPIVANAYAINEGNTQLIQNEYFQIITKDTDEEMLEEIKTILLKNYKSSDPFFCQVLSPTHKGLAGVDNINKVMQDLINPKDGRKELVYGSIHFREGSKIIMTRNNYEKGYCNGDIGIVVEVKANSLVVNIQGTDIEITDDILSDIDLAYSNTIHKSQGSEYPITIISLPDEPKCMLKRNLLYTAVTRAKQKVIIVTGKSAMYTSIKTCSNGTRKTHLKERLRKIFLKEKEE